MIHQRNRKVTLKPHDSDLVLADHLREIRRRLMWPFLVFILAGVGCYLVYDKIFALLQAPLHAPLYFTSPQGGFNVMLGICSAGGLIAAVPFLAYHILAFLHPVFPKRITMRLMVVFAVVSSVLASLGVAFALFVVVPLVLRFFTGFQTEGLSALITASSYFDLITKLFVTFALIFQLPLVLWGVNRIKPLSPRRLFGFEKYIIVGSVAIGVLVPFAFDLTTQALVALPIILLYNLSIGVVIIDSALRRQPAVSSQAPLAQAPVEPPLHVPASHPASPPPSPQGVQQGNATRKKSGLISDFIR